MNQLKEKDIYNAATGAAKSINPVNIFAEVGVGEEIDKYFKDWATTKKVDIRPWIDKSGKVNPYYFEKYSVEGISKEELQGALNTFYAQPHIQQALGVEAWNIKKQYTPEQQQLLATEGKQTLVTKWEASKKEELNNLETLEKNKGNKSVQQIVESSGFKTFDEYKEAKLNAIAETDSEMLKQDVTFDDVVSDGVKSKYTNLNQVFLLGLTCYLCFSKLVTYYHLPLT